MDEEAHITDTESAESSAPVETTSEPSASTEDKIYAEMSQTFDRIEAREGGRQPDTQRANSPPGEIADGNEDSTTPETLSPPSSITRRTGLDAWNATPKEVQQLILDREREAQEKITSQGTEIAELRKAGGLAGELSEVLEYFTPRLPPGMAQMPKVQQIASLYSAAERLERDPIGSLKYLADYYGVNLGQLAHDPQSEAQRQQAQAQLQHQVAQLHSQQQQQLQQRVTYLQKQVEDYAKDKAHWPSIEAEIGTQIAAIKTQNPGLAEIDPMAVLREAEKRALSITGVQDRQAVAEAKKKADAAKRLAQLNVKSSSGSSPKAASGDMYSEMREIYEQINGRG